MSRIILLGPPGVGKGTQATLLSRAYQIPHITTGGMFREAYADRTSLGVQAHDMYWGEAAGCKLAPDDITNRMLIDRIGMEDCSSGYILDGFPRTIPQAVVLDEFLADSTSALDAIILLEADESELIDRIIKRSNCDECGTIYGKVNLPNVEGICDSDGTVLEKREDDTEEAMRQRLGVYNRQTVPLIEFYGKRLVRVDGLKASPDVFRSIQSHILF